MAGTAKDGDDLDVDALDSSWDDDESQDDEDDDVDSLAGGWDSPKRGRTAAEKARARREKAWLKAQRRKAHAAEIAKKQKQKQPKARRADEDAPPAVETTSDGGDAKPVKTKAPPKKKRSSQFGTNTWIAIGVITIVTIGALIYALR